jgi:peptide/nickel transport system permease protein
LKFYLKKAAGFFLALFLVSVLSFLAFNVIPGDPAQLILGTEATPESIAALHEQLGLNDSLPVRYGRWAGGLLRGDLGTSIQYSRPVAGLIGDRMPVTASLAVLSLLFVAVLSVPLGVYAAKKKGSAVGRLLDAATMLNLSLPGFFSRHPAHLGVRGAAARFHARGLCGLPDGFRGLSPLSDLSRDCRGASERRDGREVHQNLRLGGA